MSQLFEIQQAGYTFHVMFNAFTVHNGLSGKTKPSAARESSLLVNKKLMDEFRNRILNKKKAAKIALTMTGASSTTQRNQP
jgi:uncharacterized FAD-dependent dehydrogenase